jgi:hypothetical protein
VVSFQFSPIIALSTPDISVSLPPHDKEQITGHGIFDGDWAELLTKTCAFLLSSPRTVGLQPRRQQSTQLGNGLTMPPP